MSRVSHVPYHQNVYDLLGIEQSECPEAARMIAEHEARHGPLPASVREWYSTSEVLTRQLYPISCNGLSALLSQIATGLQEGMLWLGQYHRDCRDCGRRGEVGQAEGWLYWDGRDDPHTEYDCACGCNLCYTFSDHLWDVLSDAPVCFGQSRTRLFWLRSPDEPFLPPVIDFLIDQFGEPERTPRPGDVTTYTFRPPGGTIRVTADAPTLTGGLSAWWVHADSAKRLAEFARLLLPWGTLRDTLRADTDSAREVLKGVRGV